MAHGSIGQVEQTLRTLHEATTAATGEQFFRALVKGMAEVLGASCCFLGLYLPGEPRRVRTHVLWRDGAFAEPIEYQPTGVPCEPGSKLDPCRSSEGRASCLPADPPLLAGPLQSVLCLPVPGPGGVARGFLAAAGRQPLPAIPELGTVLGVFAARAGVELDRLESHRELLRSEALFRMIVTNCAEGVSILDAEGVIRYANPQLAAMLAEPSPDDLLGKSYRDYTPQAQLAAIQDRRARRRAGLAERYEAGLRRRDGGEVRVEVSASPVAGAGGAVAGTIALFRDVTEQRALDEQVREAQKRESLGVLAGGVAHEFNNLLVGILANAGYVAAELGEAPDLAAAMGDVKRAAQKASELTRQLLAYSGRGKFKVGPVDVNDVVAQMVALATPALRQRARLVQALGDGLPTVEGDVGQLGQVVMSLLSNGADALGEQGGTVQARTRLVELDHAALARFQGGVGLAEGRYVMLEVEDDGAGMDEATRARIFEPFFTTKFIGRGLGLAAAMGILKAHRGAIRVQSEPGRGSIVSVVLPPYRQPQAAPAAEPAAAGAPATDRPVVLVADDEDVVRRAARRALERAGFEVLEAADGLEAVALFAGEASRISCVLLDLTMPGMGGEEALAAIRERSAGVAVVLTSGFSDRDEASTEASDPRVGFLPKPFGPSDLLAAVRGAMGLPAKG